MSYTLHESNRLKIFFDNNGTFADYTKEMENFITSDTFTMSNDGANDYLYIGKLDKPIHNAYFYVSTINVDAGSLNGEYYNGSSWATLPGFNDGTDNFTESGFIDWNVNIDDEEKVTINSTEGYWYRFRPTLSMSCTFKGISMLFSTDTDLSEEFYAINDYKQKTIDGTSESDFIRLHQSARNEIVQRLNNSGFSKKNSDGNRERLDYWDVLDRFEVRQASKYLALSKLFFELSDDVDDKFYQKARDYKTDYNRAIDSFKLSIDMDDDGKVDDHERQRVNHIRIRRV